MFYIDDSSSTPHNNVIKSPRKKVIPAYGSATVISVIPTMLTLVPPLVSRLDRATSIINFNVQENLQFTDQRISSYKRDVTSSPADNKK
jgi:hypothetical protein